MNWFEDFDSNCTCRCGSIFISAEGFSSNYSDINPICEVCSEEESKLSRLKYHIEVLQKNVFKSEEDIIAKIKMQEINEYYGK